MARKQVKQATRPTRGPNHFKGSDVIRAARSVTAAGLHVTGVEIDPGSGKIHVRVGRPGEGAKSSTNEWDTPDEQGTPPVR